MPFASFASAASAVLAYPEPTFSEERTMTVEPWVSVDDIATRFGVAMDWVYRWIEKKGLSADRIERLWKFKLSEVDEWVNAGGAADTPATADNTTAEKE